MSTRDLVQEMRFSGAQLFKREQQCGGHMWELVGGKFTPATLQNDASRMERDGTIKRQEGSREEYVLWDASTIK